MIVLNCLIILTVASVCVKGQGTRCNGLNQLHPVHGLYVKPSIDGTTGDLYVAATEESGVKTQWLTDAPINFLPVASASQTHQTTIPVSFAPGLPQEETGTATQKRAVISPTVQYAYAMPVTSTSEGNPISPYPYPIPITSLTTNPSETATSSCPMDAAKANIPQYSPFQYFYPHMLSAYSNAMSVLKDAGLSDDTASSIMTQASPMWSPYSYPTYVMVDPATWAQSQTTTVPTSANNSADNS